MIDGRRATGTGAGLELVLRADGAFALVAGGVVTGVDARGESVLDPGPGEEPGSLALAGNGRHIYWLNRGQPRSAPLN